MKNGMLRSTSNRGQDTAVNQKESKKTAILKVLNRQDCGRFIFAPNYWQWFSHHKNHGLFPQEIRHFQDQLELIRYLGADVFSRNIYCDQTKYWFGGLADEVFDGVDIETCEAMEGKDRITTRRIITGKGVLTERLRYIFAESTVVQEKFLVDDVHQLPALEEFIRARRWQFHALRYQEEQNRVGEDGVVAAGELHSPLKTLHLILGPINATYLIHDHHDFVKTICSIHEQAQLDLVRQMAQAGVPAMMAMDNLDTMFHPPHYVEKYSASFYEKASGICHTSGSNFFIHACGQQRANLKLIASLRVDGLEGVAFPPLGDISLPEAMEMTNDSFIVTGGISAAEFENLTTREEIYAYVRTLFGQMRPYRHRFIFSASCNTPINASFEQIRLFRDAWNEFKTD
jgi:hypothetical protein